MRAAHSPRVLAEVLCQPGPSGARPLEHVGLLATEPAQEVHRREVGERVRKLDVLVDRTEKVGAHDLQAGEKLDRGLCLGELVEESS